MKKFKNSFGVKGSPSLLQALKEEVEKLGWKYDSNFSSGYSKRTPDLYFNANKFKDSMKPQHFSFSNVFDCTIYNLPEQWDECLKAASELVEEVPEYVEFISDDFSYLFTKGTIYPLNKNGNCQGDDGEYHWSMQYPENKKFMVPSTKEAYEKQQEEFKMKELLKEAEKRYAVGTEFRCLVTGNVYLIPENTIFKTEIGYWDMGKNVYSYVNWALFHKHYHNGEWAEIISKSEEPMEIAGYSVKFEDDKVSVGCYKDITLKQLKTLRKAIKIVNDLGNDLTITEDGIIEHRDDNQISLEEIEELIKRLNG